MATKSKDEKKKTAVEAENAPKAVRTNAKRKLCRIISYEKMTPEVRALFEEKYANGYEDFVTRYPKPNGDYFFAVSLSTEDTDYLVKVEVKVDVDLDGDDDDDVIGTPGDEEMAGGVDDEDPDDTDSRRGGDASDFADSIADDEEPADVD